jgi:23S rRNA (uracil1939-C5)-methyltransferase
MPQEAYRALKRQIIERALTRQGLDVDALNGVFEVEPGARRRCVFKAARRGDAVRIGFHARASHEIVDMRACRVLTRGLFGLVEPLRALLLEIFCDGEAAEIHATEADDGIDLGFRWRRKFAPAQVALLARWAERNNVARIVSGVDVVVSLRVPQLKIGGAQVEPPPFAFLQATRTGEALLQKMVCEALAGAKSTADLFAGCGTFALSLARHAKVHAVEQDGAMLSALERGARATSGLKPVSVERRDLFRRPLEARELDRFDSVALDPPRAGAAAQTAQLARSRVRRIAYVSCNAASFARDARALTDAGFRMRNALGVDQFLWSEHIELVGIFERR